MTHFTALLEIKSHNQNGEFTGYASVFNIVDLHGDVIVPGAFQKQMTRSSKLPKMLWQHDNRVPIGVWREIREDAHGLFVKGKLLMELQQGREAYALMQAGVLDGLSIGFRCVKSTKSKESRGRVLEEIDLHEISLVTFAANPEARVLDIKAMENEERMILRLLEKVKGG